MKSLVLLVTGIFVMFAVLVPEILAQAGAVQNYANTTIKNESGKPLKLITIAGSGGEPIADLVITGKEMTFNENQMPVHGAGLIEARPGKRFRLTMILSCSDEARGKKNMLKVIGLRLRKIVWDERGKTLELVGLDPVIETSTGEKFQIVSELEKPEIKDGAVSITIAEKGQFELVFAFDGGGDKRGYIKQGQCRLFDPATHPMK